MIGPKSPASSSNPELRLLSPRICKLLDRYFLSSGGRDVYSIAYTVMIVHFILCLLSNIYIQLNISIMLDTLSA